MQNTISPNLSTIADVKKYVEEWANQVAKQRGTTIAYIDYLVEREEPRKYLDVRFSKFNVEFLKCELEHPAFEPSLTPAEFYQEYATNNTPEKQTTEFSHSVTKENVFELSSTNSIGWSNTAEFKLDLPFIGSTKLTTTLKLDYSSTEKKTTRESNTKTIKQTFVISPFSRNLFSATIQQNVYKEIGVNYELKLKGSIPIWFDDKIDLNNPGGNDLHWLWFPTIESIVFENPSEFFKRNSDGDVIFKGRAVLNGQGGIVINVIMTEVSQWRNGTEIYNQYPNLSNETKIPEHKKDNENQNILTLVVIKENTTPENKGGDINISIPMQESVKNVTEIPQKNVTFPIAKITIPERNNTIPEENIPTAFANIKTALAYIKTALANITQTGINITISERNVTIPKVNIPDTLVDIKTSLANITAAFANITQIGMNISSTQ